METTSVSSSTGIAANSHYLESIPSDGECHGRSRNWGDIDATCKKTVTAEIVSEAKQMGLNEIGIAFVLAVAKVESGFNPDAASTSSSAAGIGQFIDKTGQGYGLDETNRFDITANTRAMISYLKDCFNSAQRRFKPTNVASLLSYTYALFHDGPSMKYGGMKIAEEQVLPSTVQFLIGE